MKQLLLRDPSELTLREAYEQFKRPRVAAKTTQEIQLQSLRKWELYTRNPPIGELANSDIAQFERACEHLSPATYNKFCGHLQALWNLLLPPSPRNPRGLGHVQHWVYFEKRKCPDPQPRWVPRQLVERIYEGCQAATWPPVPVDIPLWWRTFLCLDWNLGLRFSNIFHFRHYSRPLVWSQIDLVEGYVNYRPLKSTKVDKLGLHPLALAHLRALHQQLKEMRYFVSENPEEPLLVFPCPRVEGDWRNQFRAIQIAAGIPAPYFTPHDLRRTCGTEIHRISPAAAQAVLGHSSLQVTQKYYADRNPLLDEVTRTREQPAAFSAILGEDVPPPEPPEPEPEKPDVIRGPWVA